MQNATEITPSRHAELIALLDERSALYVIIRAENEEAKKQPMRLIDRVDLQRSQKNRLAVINNQIEAIIGTK